MPPVSLLETSCAFKGNDLAAILLNFLMLLAKLSCHTRMLRARSAAYSKIPRLHRL